MNFSGNKSGKIVKWKITEKYGNVLFRKTVILSQIREKSLPSLQLVGAS